MLPPKFEDCRLCRNFASAECEGCDAGENFEPRGVRPLSFDDYNGHVENEIDDDFVFRFPEEEIGFDDEYEDDL